ncbi:hypothetical protein M407DRAFT_132392 [Tulasnella calospora MUT 4182]|uniref:Uncharacterized protein n=1 Tax=Tulasnella calospora MUT 4182 TaxID=1051891 RepID=A0A0C3QA74_9AGAM|nr:hypothetical protein M407DRAFT_132392 [Tulasnella calospora MUT 4182]
MLGLGKGLGFNLNGVHATCLPRNFQGERGPKSQEWFLQPEDDELYTLRNSDGGTVLEIANGSSKNYTAVQGWTRDPDKGEQLWRLERRSRTSTEIASVFGNTPPFNTSEISLENILADVGREWRPIEYVTLLEGFRTRILLDSGWINKERGQHDYIDFVKGTQSAVHTRAGERIGVPGVRVLFGVVEGAIRGEKRAYNWALTQDLCSVIFLDPQTGREYTARGLELKGFSPTSVSC